MRRWAATARSQTLKVQSQGHVTRHTSHVTRHTSHVTRHTSHVTRHTSHVPRHTGPIIISLSDRDSVMEGLDDYCNQTVNLGASSSSSSSSAAAAAEASSGAEPQTPGIRAEKTYTFDRFPAVLGLHLNRFDLQPLSCSGIQTRCSAAAGEAAVFTRAQE